MASVPSGSAPPPPPPIASAPRGYAPSSYGVDPYAYAPPSAPYGGGLYGGGAGGIGAFGGGYNAYGAGGGYGPGMYGQYGGGGLYGGGVGPTAESNFVRLAEESSRNAFQSIESVVSAVSAVANMLNSTHAAVFSSFRAVIGVVEQFSMAKRQLAAVFTFTLVRWLRAVWRRLMVVLRLKPANYAMASDAWTDVAAPASGISWPSIIFWLIALGGPYLIYSCVSQMVRRVEEKQRWATGAAEHHRARALYDFVARTPAELSVRAGDALRVAPRDEQPRIKGWLLAASESGAALGLVPLNYVKVLRQTSETPPRVGSPSAPTSAPSTAAFESAFVDS